MGDPFIRRAKERRAQVKCGHEWPCPGDQEHVHRCRALPDHINAHRCPCGASTGDALRRTAQLGRN